jgi:orotate phosphoribosyltransferase
VIDAVATLAKSAIGSAQIDCVSGGERRDWFFSLLTAKRLQKPALVLFKDRSAVMVRGENNNAEIRPPAAAELHGARVLHVADLVTEASSYVRAWLPAIQSRGGSLQWAINVVDRGQGGEEMLARHGIAARHLVQLGPDFFEMVAKAGHLSQAAAQQLLDYHIRPQESMRKFLQEHPQILREALRGDDMKIRQRARQLVEQNTYGFAEEFLRQFAPQ